PSLVRAFTANMADLAGRLPIAGVAKMIIGESRNFPELARIWHDALVARALGVFSGVIERAQARGEVRPGDPRVYALSFIGPLLLTLLWTEPFAPTGAQPFDLRAVIAQHVDALLGGLLTAEARP